MADIKEVKYSFLKKDRDKSTSDPDIRTLVDCLRVYSERIPERAAVIFRSVDGTRSILTFKELHQNSVKAAKCFIKLGVKQSEYVGISANTCSDWLFAYFGALLAGAVPLCLAITYTDGSDVVAMVQKMKKVSTLVLSPGEGDANWKIVQALLSRYKCDGSVTSDKMPSLRYLVFTSTPTGGDTRTVLTLNAMLTWKTSGVVLPGVNPDDVSALIQTSGSTGVPKAVVHTHKSSLSAAKTFAQTMNMDSESICFSDRPFNWAAGFPATVYTGHTRVCIIGSGVTGDKYLDFLFNVIQTEGCTHMMTLPFVINRLMKKQEEMGTPLPFKTILAIGQPIGKQFAGCIGKLCQCFGNAYGSTETGLLCCGKVVDENDFVEYSVGSPQEGVEIRIVNANGETVPIFERGEIYVKCDALFKEYYNDPEKTRDAMTTDGWFRTDDVGYMSDDETVYVTGRKSEMILSGGLNITPTILEAVLVNCPGVARVVCVPVPHPVMFQVVCACVILKAGSDATEETIRDYCEAFHNDKPRLFTVVPMFYLFFKEFPETFSGKIERQALIKMAAEKFGSK